MNGGFIGTFSSNLSASHFCPATLMYVHFLHMVTPFEDRRKHRVILIRLINREHIDNGGTIRAAVREAGDIAQGSSRQRPQYAIGRLERET